MTSRARLYGGLVANIRIVPAALVVALVVALGAAEGGTPATTWYPAAVFVLALLAVCAVGLPRPRPPRRAVVAAALFAAYAGWCVLSIIWADQQGQAWDGGNRALMYAAVFAVVALWPLRAGPAVALIGLFGFAIAAVGLVELLRAASAPDAIGYFIDARLAEPLGYQNANVAFWTCGLIACTFVASRREIPALVRGAALGSAGLLAGLALMGGSRGWLFTLPVALLLFIVVTPGRIRLSAALAAVGAGVLAMHRPVLDVYGEYKFGGRLGMPGGQEIEPLLRDARTAILLTAVVLALVGIVVGLVDRRVELSKRVQRASGIAAAVAVAVVGAGSLATWAVAGDPVGEVEDAWEEFKGGQSQRGETRSRFGASLGSNRYDFWRVAWEEFEDSPLVGAGADNYQQAYLLRGRSTEAPDFPHSLPLKVLSETGVVGALLLLAAVAAALSVALGVAFRRKGLAGAAAGASTSIFLYWGVHGAVDWFWEFPALGGAAFAFLGVAVALAPSRRTRGPASDSLSRSRWPRGVLIAASTLLGLVCAASLVFPWLAAQSADFAVDSWRNDADQAFESLERAADLNPLSTRPDALAAGIALRVGRPDLARVHFLRVLDRDPRSAYAHMQLGALASVRGERAEALELLGRALELSPRDDVKRYAFREVRGRRPVGPLELDRLLVEQIRRRIGEQK